MHDVKKILAPTDLSELSLAGVRYALDLARTVGAEVTVYHAIGPEELAHYSRLGPMDDPIGKYEAALAGFLKEHCSDLLRHNKVHTKVGFGMPEVDIVEEAEKEGADLIVVSTHGRTGLSHILVGSVTERIVRHALCPVLSIRPEKIHKPAQVAAA